ncbi:uncharacterized protein LOC144089409 [Stigmatopora argus]
MADLGVPYRFIRWIANWLTNRTARVRINNTIGRSRTFKEGLPQGSVLSPLLFIIYINDLLDKFNDSTLVSAYADDLALACRGRNKEEVESRLQAEVEKFCRWRSEAHLNLNTTKCEASFFSLDSAEAKWQPKILINGATLKHNPTPTFLGVSFDRQLTFAEQAKKVRQTMSKRTNLLRKLSGTSWGWQPNDLRTVYIATQRSLAEYAAPAWAPWLAQTHLKSLETTQLEAARAITHHLRSTPTEAVLHEAHLTPLSSRLKLQALLKADAWNQLPPSDPRHRLLYENVKMRLQKKPDWRSSTLPRLTALELHTPCAYSSHPCPPWLLPPPSKPPLPQSLNTCRPSPKEIRQKSSSEAWVNRTYRSSQMDPPKKALRTVVQVLSSLRRLQSSTNGMVPLAAAAAPTTLKSIILSDCKSLVQAMGNTHMQDPAIRRLQGDIALFPPPKRLQLLWIPGHCNICGNDLADALAKLGLLDDQTNTPPGRSHKTCHHPT